MVIRGHAMVMLWTAMGLHGHAMAMPWSPEVTYAITTVIRGNVR